MSVRRCRVCGCTQNQACEGGCWWVAADLCSSCKRERPILFSGLMVQRIIEGRKTQTRRAVRVPVRGGAEFSIEDGLPVADCIDGETRPIPCPYGQPKDQLWVRETWQHEGDPYPFEEGNLVFYRADYLDDPHGPDGEKSREGKYRTWRPSIHMPRAACRLVLEITDLRVERLLDISDADCMAEGVRPTVDGNGHDWRHDESGARRTFRQLWQSINGPASWDANPWVWAITFKKVSG